MPVLSVRKLQTSDDEGIHHELARLDDADSYAREIIIAGAFPERDEAWGRIYDAIETLSNVTPTQINEATDECDRECFVEQGYQAAYHLGIAVGLRLAGVGGRRPAVRSRDSFRGRS